MKCELNISKANEALSLYRFNDVESEMAYPLWAAIHADMEIDMKEISRIGFEQAKSRNFAGREFEFLGADALANEMYDTYHT